MENDNFEPPLENVSQSDGEDLKKKIAEQSLKSAEQVQEDPSRSSLHYGEDERSEGIDEVRPDGALATSSLQPQDSSEEGEKAPEASSVRPAPAVSSSGAEQHVPNVENTEQAEAPRQGARSRADADQIDGIGLASDEKVSLEPGQAESQSGPQISANARADIADESAAPEPVQDASGGTITQNAAPTDINLSNTAVAENAEGAVIGHLSVDDTDLQDSHSFTVSDDRFEVVEGALKLKEGMSLDHGEADSLTLEVTAVDQSGASFTQSFEIGVADMPEVQHESGFHAQYFDMNKTLRKLDDVDWQADPTHQELISEINYENGKGSFWEGGSKDTFGVQITGTIDVEEGGTFDFYAGGDDGVVLFVNGVEVIDNDGLHGFRTRSGEIELEPGTHVIEVRYFENYGHAGLKLEWEGPGTGGRSLLTAPTAEDMQTVSGMPLSLQLDVETGAAGTTHVIEGLPAGSTVAIGDTVFEIGDTGAVDVTGMDLSLVNITPPSDFTGDVAASLTTTVPVGEATATQSHPITFEVNPADISPPTLDVQTGFKASYFDVDHGLRKLEDIDWDATPTHEEVVSEINYENGRDSFWDGGSTDTFGARLTGEITVEDGGTYNFYLGGDDGVVLYINGEEIIDNDGLHSFKTSSGEVELPPGTHEIEVRYFENYGHAGLKLEWEGPDTDGRELVQADSAFETDMNGAIDISLGASDLGENGFATLSGLPADTILVSGEMTAVSDGTDVTLEGWNLDLLEIMPPPGFAGEINAEVTVSKEGFNGQMVEASTSFQIVVEGDATPDGSAGGPDDLILMVQADGMDAGDAGWVELASGEDPGEGGSGEDEIMQEAVATGSEAEQTGEIPETYERQDW